PVWRDVMMWLHREEASPAPTPPPRLVRHDVAFPRHAEPPLLEWFVDGTEPAAIVARAAVPPPAIVAPLTGTRIAIDPDIPASRQRVMVEARHVPDEARWVLDGLEIGE